MDKEPNLVLVDPELILDDLSSGLANFVKKWEVIRGKVS
jgi:hypothetical protein